MSLVAFDTLKYASRLEKSGFERKQAAELAEAQMEVLGELMQEKLATKEDLRIVSSDFETQIHECKTELQAQIHECKDQIHETEMKLQVQISQLSTSMKEIQNSLLRWMTTLFAGSVAALSFVMSAFKFLH